MDFSFKNLSFYYGRKKILNNLNITFKKGEVVALVGENGAGKSTLLKIIAGFFHIRNMKVVSSSFLIDDPSFYPYLTANENLKYIELINSRKLLDINEALEMVDLKLYKNVKVTKFSYGMKKRLAIAKMLLIDADFYLFDEPLNGLDIKSIIKFRKVISFLKEKNKCVIISSHILGELEKYADKVIMINNEHSVVEFLLEKNKREYLFITGSGQYNICINCNMLNDYVEKLVNSGVKIFDIIKQDNKIERFITTGGVHD